MRDANHAYLAYKVGVGTYDVRIVRMTRSGSGNGTWNVDATSFHLSQVQAVLGAPGSPSLNPSRPWRDFDPVDFDVGMSGTRLYLVIAERGANTQTVHLFWCDDTSLGACSWTPANGTQPEMNSPNWNEQTFQLPLSQQAGQLQPGVAADVGGPGVAATWYQFTDFTTAASLVAAGAYSNDGGLTWSRGFQLSNPFGACATVGSDTPPYHYFGDYVGSVVLPFPLNSPEINLVSPRPWTITAHADSEQGCFNMGDLTYDQHVQAVLW
jgi:hypothetical protein